MEKAEWRKLGVVDAACRLGCTVKTIDVPQRLVYASEAWHKVLGVMVTKFVRSFPPGRKGASNPDRS
jgi:hypothetical protein